MFDLVGVSSSDGVGAAGVRQRAHSSWVGALEGTFAIKLLRSLLSDLGACQYGISVNC